MYTAQILSARIKKQAKNKEVQLKDLLEQCDLNVNSINQMSDKKGLSSFSLAKIADRLETTTDYLLGRSDNPEMITISDNTQNNVNGNNNIQVSAISEAENEINSILSQLSPRERTELMMMIYRFADEHKKQN